MSSTPQLAQPVTPAKPPLKKGAVIAIVAGILGFFLVILAALFLYPGAVPKSTPLVSRIAATTDRPVEIQARLERSVLDNQTVPDRLDVLVTNYGAAPLTKLQLTLVAPGFAMPEGQPKEAALPQDGLKTGQTFLFQAPMQAAAGSGSYSIASQVSWVDKAQHARTVTVGPVLFDGRFGAARWARLGTRSAALVKDLALPLLLLILTTIFATRQSRKEALDRIAEANAADAKRLAEVAAAEARRVAEVAAAAAKADADMKAADAKKLAEEALERIRQDEERKREERLQVTRLLLERVMDLAQTYYLPIVAAAKLAFRDIQRCKDSPASAEYAKVTYDLFRIIHLFDVFRKEKGGLFLRSFDGEYVAWYSWELAKETFVAILTRDLVNLCIADKELLGSYGSYLNGKAPFDDAEKRVKAWILNDAGMAKHGKFEDYLGALDVIQAVLRYEINRPFWDNWYEHPAGEEMPWKFDQPTTCFPPDSVLTESQKSYVQELSTLLPKYCKRSVTRSVTP